jgi:hypothetical protein
MVGPAADRLLGRPAGYHPIASIDQAAPLMTEDPHFNLVYSDGA